MKVRVLVLLAAATVLALAAGSPGAAQGNGDADFDVARAPAGPAFAPSLTPPDIDVQNSSSQCVTYVSPNVPMDIPQTAFMVTVISRINVPHDFVVTDVSVGPLYISHNWVSDLDLYLTSPQGTQVELHTPSFTGGADYQSTAFWDGAANPITSGSPPFVGAFQPEGSLASINGESAAGEWQLSVTNWGSTAGTLDAWSIWICGFPGEAAVVPAGLESVAGNAQNSAPFDIGSTPYTSMRYQQVYGAADLPGRGRIAQMAFRVDETSSSFIGFGVDVQIRLAHTDAAPDGLSMTYADNLDRDVTLIYDGPLFLRSSAWGGPPRIFDIVIGANAGFFYNGVDNLLLDVQLFAPSSTEPFDAQNAPGDSVSRIWSFDVTDSVAGFADSYGLVTQFIMDSDADGDGCTNAQELGPDVTQGGQRDPKSFWDFFDVPTGAPLARDRNVASLDIFQVLGRFNATDLGPGDFDRSSDPLSTPNAFVPGADRANYHPAYDRGPVTGPNAWDLGPADGAIAAPDIFAVLGQFGHSCP